MSQYAPFATAIATVATAVVATAHGHDGANDASTGTREQQHAGTGTNKWQLWPLLMRSHSVRYGMCQARVRN